MSRKGLLFQLVVITWWLVSIALTDGIGASEALLSLALSFGNGGIRTILPNKTVLFPPLNVP
jgi:hypothetical protein